MLSGHCFIAKSLRAEIFHINTMRRCGESMWEVLEEDTDKEKLLKQEISPHLNLRRFAWACGSKSDAEPSLMSYGYILVTV